MKTYGKFLTTTLIGLAITLLAGCAAMQTSISKKELDVQTKMSETIFMDPLPPAKQVVFVQITNTSDKPDFDIKNKIVNSIQAKGYKVTRDPEQAYIWLQANILKVGKADLRDSRDALDQGYGGAISGAAVGAAIGSAGNFNGSTLAGGVVGGLIGMTADALVKDINYTTIVDVRISERTKADVKSATDSSFKQGTSGQTTLAFNENTHWKKFQTRIVANANKANLKFDEASPLLVAGISHSIAGMFGA